MTSMPERAAMFPKYRQMIDSAASFTGSNEYSDFSDFPDFSN
jgi:hypothetical protein